MIIGLLIYVTFFSPSLKFTLLIYLPIYVVMHLFQMSMRYNMKDDKTFKMNIAIICLIATDGFIFFYLMHIKELSRFAQHHVAVKKQLQVSNVLNSQSDSIVVVQMVT